MNDTVYIMVRDYSSSFIARSENGERWMTREEANKKVRELKEQNSNWNVIVYEGKPQ